MQDDLFGDVPGRWPDGFQYRDDFLGRAEEAALLRALQAMPLAPAQYKGYTARREVVSFGGRFDYDTNTLLPGDPVPEVLWPLRARLAGWVGLPADAFEHALVARYAPGTPLGWHRDVPDFEVVAGVSLAGFARMRLRPYPPVPLREAPALDVDLAPRSIYVMRGAARWDWQHSVAPTEALRWSITFRTRRSGCAVGRP